MNGLFSINSPLWSISSKALNFLWLSILWLVCSLPVITIGASTSALYSITLKYVRNEEGYLTASFFTAFRQNLRQGAIIWLVLLLAGLFLGLDFVFYYRGEQTGIGYMILMTLFFSLALVFVLMNLYVYAVLAKFQNSVFHIIKSSCIMALCHWPSSLAMLMLSLLILAVGFLAFPPLLFFAPAGLCYMHSKFLCRIFDGYIAA
ncbi:YesL family protein [Lacrimispora sp. BS-2]|uniref:YesL family protein n=1 Tax=Lacrimispora sp. BS-2 TaxID=3151850 RepID=A0AAU7PKM0_9FIRM